MQLSDSTTNGNGVVATALMGAAAGAAGVWALDRADWFMWDRESLDSRWQTISVRPRHLPPAENVVSAIDDATEHEISRPAFQAASQAVHYSIGIAPAVAYAIFRDRFPVGGVARGALYGLTLFLAQDELLNTVTGLGAKPRDYPWQAHARGVVAHVIYGVATELVLNLIEDLAASQDARRRQGTWSAGEVGG